MSGPAPSRQRSPFPPPANPALKPSTRDPDENSNRESKRLETIANHSKEKTAAHSNRELAAVFYAPLCPAISAPSSEKGEQKANRESLRLEIEVTPTKQRPDDRSNREKEALFQTTITRKPPTIPTKNASTPPSFLFRVDTKSNDCFLALTDNSNHTHVSGTASGKTPPSSTTTPGCFGPKRAHPTQKSKSARAPQSNSNSKSFAKHPPFLLRLETTPITCFVRVTANSNLPMLRLRRSVIEPEFRLNRPLSPAREKSKPPAGAPAARYGGFRQIVRAWRNPVPFPGKTHQSSPEHFPVTSLYSARYRAGWTVQSLLGCLSAAPSLSPLLPWR